VGICCPKIKGLICDSSAVIISVAVVAVAASVSRMGGSMVGSGIVYALYCSSIVYVLYYVGTYFFCTWVGCRL